MQSLKESKRVGRREREVKEAKTVTFKISDKYNPLSPLCLSIFFFLSVLFLSFPFTHSIIIILFLIAVIKTMRLS